MESLEIPKGTKAEIYEALIPQIQALIEGETDLYANLANVAAALKEAFNHFWVGFYLVKQNDSSEDYTLILGPFQGPVACTRIKYGKGVCGTAWKDQKTLVVPDVDQFPGHIACSSLSKSEIVVPILLDNKVVAILDIDSDVTNSYDHVDAHYLEQLTSTLSQHFTFPK